jgi:hypothetical protein
MVKSSSITQVSSFSRLIPPTLYSLLKLEIGIEDKITGCPRKGAEEDLAVIRVTGCIR